MDGPVSNPMGYTHEQISMSDQYLDDACRAIISCVTLYNACGYLNNVVPSPLEVLRVFLAIVDHQILC